MYKNTYYFTDEDLQWDALRPFEIRNRFKQRCFQEVDCSKVDCSPVDIHSPHTACPSPPTTSDAVQFHSGFPSCFETHYRMTDPPYNSTMATFFYYYKSAKTATTRWWNTHNIAVLPSYTFPSLSKSSYGIPPSFHKETPLHISQIAR